MLHLFLQKFLRRLNTNFDMRLTINLCNRLFSKASFRRPMEGRNVGKKKGLFLWPKTFGELDEEVEVNGQLVPTRDRVPQIMVPDLKDCRLKPYVTYRAKEIYEPPMQAKDFFDTFYASAVEAEMKNIPLESIPNEKKKSLFSFFKSDST